MTEEFNPDRVCERCGKKFNLFTDGGRYLELSPFGTEDIGDEKDQLELCFCSDKCKRRFDKKLDKIIMKMMKNE